MKIFGLSLGRRTGNGGARAADANNIPAATAAPDDAVISTVAPPDGEAIVVGASGSTGATVRAGDDGSISIEDHGSLRRIEVTGEVVTAPGGRIEITEAMREIVLATSTGQVFVSRSHQYQPRVLTAIARIEMIQGPATQTNVVDMATIRQIYDLDHRRVRRIDTRSRNSSEMQLELVRRVAQAAKINASDIHIIVNQSHALVRFRVDGVMRDIDELQPQHGLDLLAAAFAMADASDATYQPLAYQAARISSLKTDLPAGVQSLRMQFNPLANEGRYLILRLLYSGAGKATSLEDLGYNAQQTRQLATMSARPVGINMISGPTGSGKSTTLKALLERVIEARGGEVNTLTIEDPPEYVIRNAQQMPVTNAKTQEERAEAFTKAISAGLRSDPDIMMIGEIRDKASADLAVEGALSGHPIYASIHANTAMDILTRLRDMGIEEFKVFDPTVFSGLVGQRLLRQLCPHCRRPLEEGIADGTVDPIFADRVEAMREVTPEHALADARLSIAGPGCEHCDGGYKSRAVLAEIILPDDDFMDLMRRGSKRDARAYWFEKLGGIDLLGAGWIRCLSGVISPVDLEHSAALLAPLPAHKSALAHWLGPDERNG